ncbi:right-handed parallel beta-helix repeat-containing protein [Microbulbifer sp. ZKSA006]|uniref:right-handed parallel beta-helix repeat-containing protein n=1 Tax=Microbulbifer sp. ZKSA006 TaxID=3243390 RepID=UPI0040397A3B
MKKVTLTTAYTLLPAIGLSISLLSHAVSCGDNITTQETLDADLSCATNPALTITGPTGSLDMADFTVVCTVATNDGISLEGLGARLSNGGIESCSDSVILSEDGAHSAVDIVIIDLSGTGVVIDSDNNFVNEIFFSSDGLSSTYGIHVTASASYNTITNNFIATSGGDGILLEGTSNNITGNAIDGTINVGINISSGANSNIIMLNLIEYGEDTGIEVNSDANLISQNEVNHNITGIKIEGASDNLVNLNEVDDNAVYGISIEGASSEGNNILSNSSSNSGSLDLYSPDDPSCTENKWSGNIYTTRDPSCLN